MTNLITAMTVQDCPYHFVLEWDATAKPQLAKVGPYVVKSLGGSMLENPAAPLIGFFLRLPPVDGTPASCQRLLVGTDFNEAFNSDGTRCQAATVDMMTSLAVMTGRPKRDLAKSVGRPTKTKSDLDRA